MVSITLNASYLIQCLVFRISVALTRHHAQESSNFADAEWFEAGLAAARRMEHVGLDPCFDVDRLHQDWQQVLSLAPPLV